MVSFDRFRGFTLIELVIVLAITGVLISVMVAAYQTYTIRAQVAEGLNLAGAAKVPIIDAYSIEGVAPVSRLESGLTAELPGTIGPIVSRVDVVRGRIDVTFGGSQAHTDIIGDTVSMTPYVSAEGTVSWRCGFAAKPSGEELLVGGAEHVPPTINERYLPGNCR